MLACIYNLWWCNYRILPVPKNSCTIPVPLQTKQMSAVK